MRAAGMLQEQPQGQGKRAFNEMPELPLENRILFPGWQLPGGTCAVRGWMPGVEDTKSPLLM